ncbi:MAG: hypothetical protein RMJ17_02150 [Candidatus Aenigmarchaeota archaeon]|nr:hypothetical protein [Candidatus Aenigmarchaeota archaeon]MDW8149375.1 hypothetical protein [Candidatus Aenigmarchaeota archaeon]
MEKVELEKLIKELEKIRGRHTELISLYIPAGANLHEISNQLVQEKGTAENIKSKATRRNVITALEKIIQHLKLFKQTPPNGLVVFCGNISPVEGKEDIKLWSFEPPEPLRVKKYWCDQVFVLDFLKEMVETKEVFGLIVLDAREANIGLLRGKELSIIKTIESNVPSKSVKGGMCLHPSTFIYKKNDLVEIKDIDLEDEILSFSFNERKKTYGNVKNIFKKFVEYGIKLTLDNKKEIIASKEHRIFVFDGKKIKEVECEKINIGNLIICKDGLHSVINKKVIYVNDWFYDLYIPKYHKYFANDVLVHNSQMRYDRIREQAIIEFLTKVGETATQIFLDQKNLKGIIIGGPGYVKEDFAKEDYLHYQLKQKILGLKHISYTGEMGLKELVEKAKDLIKETEIAKEKEIISKFLLALKEENKNVVYNLENVLKAIESKNIDKLLIYEDLKILKENYSCSCGYEKTIIRESTKIFQVICDKCGNKMNLKKQEEITNDIISSVKEFGEVFFISRETEEGIQFTNITKIAAFLKFSIQ